MFQKEKNNEKTKKHPRWNLRHPFVKKLLKFNVTKYLKEDPVADRT